MANYLDRLDLKARGVCCHTPRHNPATWARAGGAKLDAVSGMLGHAPVTALQVYAKIVDRMIENPAKYLKGMLTTWFWALPTTTKAGRKEGQHCVCWPLPVQGNVPTASFQGFGPRSLRFCNQPVKVVPAHRRRGGERDSQQLG